MSSLIDIMRATLRKYAETIGCGRVLPDYLQKQIDGIYEMEDNYQRGLATLADGLTAERDYLEAIIHE